MLTPFELVTNGIVVVLAAIMLLTLVMRIESPPGTLLARMYAAEPLSKPVNSMFLGLLGLSSALRLSVHMGLLGSWAVGDTAMIMLGIPMLVLAPAALFLMGRGMMRALRTAS